MSPVKKLWFTKYCIFFSFLATSCAHQNELTNYAEKHAMVVSAHPIASKVGLEIMKNGGNAADAVVAVQMALAVVYPSAGNIGGGGFLVYRSKDGSAISLDFREKASGSASSTMYLDENSNVVENLSLIGHKSVGVPGTVDGMVKFHQRFGSLPWESLIQPAIDIAIKGFNLTKMEAEKLNYFNANKCISLNEDNPYFSELFKEGDTLRLLELAETLKIIKNNKRSGFYEGIIASKIIEEIKNNGGIISHLDLAAYESVWRKPIISSYKNYKIIGMGPPSSGGILLSQMLKMLEHFNLDTVDFHSDTYIHLIAEIERRSFADRSEHLGDPDFHEVPLNRLLDSTYLLERLKTIKMTKATKSDTIKPGNFYNNESEETTHFSIVDNLGNSVAVTTTLNSSFGSGVIVKDAGFILNNEMDDFSIKPGYPNLYGLIGGIVNSIEPGKRMLSSMTPTILEKDNELFMVVGSPGGSTIITAVLQTILNVIEYEMTIDSAVRSPRFHHQWLPDQIKMEDIFVSDTLLTRKLKELGHNLKFVSSMNRVDAILVRNGLLYGGADPRGDDYSASF